MRCHSPEDGWDDGECSEDRSRERPPSSGQRQSWLTDTIGAKTGAMTAETGAMTAVTTADRGSSAKHEPEAGIAATTSAVM